MFVTVHVNVFYVYNKFWSDNMQQVHVHVLILTTDLRFFHSISW